MLLRPRWPADEAPFVAFFSALAVARALEGLEVGEVKLKWPNDVLVNGKKIAGVLIEPRIKSGRVEFVVVGIGINVLHRQEDLEPLGKAAATSCFLEGAHASCDDVVIRVLTEFDLCYYMIQRGDKAAIINEWSRRNFTGKNLKAE